MHNMNNNFSLTILSNNPITMIILSRNIDRWELQLNLCDFSSLDQKLPRPLLSANCDMWFPEPDFISKPLQHEGFLLAELVYC